MKRFFPSRLRVPLRVAFTGFLLAGAGLAQMPVEVFTKAGNLTLRVAPRGNLRVERTRRGGPSPAEDCRVERTEERLRIWCEAPDDQPVDLTLEMPYGIPVRAVCPIGDIELDGLFRSAAIRTETGSVRLRVPLLATNLDLRAREAPKKWEPPEGVKLQVDTDSRVAGWWVEDKLSKDWITFGKVELFAVAPAAVAIEDMPLPADSPVKLPWQAKDLVDELIAEVRAPRRRDRPSGAPGEEAPAPSKSGEFVFRSDVRLVSLSVAVTDKDGRPVHDLTPDDFVVTEDGVPQEITAADAEGVPFNLALLLDLSGSTRNDRPAMQEAARRFVELARPNDRLALYALADDTFVVVSRLTSDRKRLTPFLNAIPKIGGGSPVYDTMVLAYAEELHKRRGERNAIIILSDGVDNQIYGKGTPSVTSFNKLRDLAKASDVLVYPVLLDPFSRVPPPGWSRKAHQRMEEIAEESGGRLFVAQSVHDLEPVYGEVADELRSVYSVSYSPKNQDFNGEWRKVKVELKRKGLKLRTREGYYAR